MSLLGGERGHGLWSHELHELKLQSLWPRAVGQLLELHSHMIHLSDFKNLPQMLLPRLGIGRENNLPYI